MILIRTQSVDHRIQRFAAQLGELSGFDVAYVIDERRGAVDPMGLAKVSLTREACERLGLYCPSDFAWRCGDYGYYLARLAYPDVPFFWMIEDDVRIAGRDPAALFDKFREHPADFVASHIEPPPPRWPWLAQLRARDVLPFKSFFPVTRLSADAIDRLSAKRRAHSRQWSRRRFWPNDEGFVATTLVAGGAHVVDLNEGAPNIYRAEDFAFDNVRDGALPLESADTVALFHPVLEGDALARKLERIAAWRTATPVRKSRLARVRDAIARRCNRLRRW